MPTMIGWKETLVHANTVESPLFTTPGTVQRWFAA
jgi:hypothetical protein